MTTSDAVPDPSILEGNAQANADGDTSDRGFAPSVMKWSAQVDDQSVEEIVLGKYMIQFTEDLNGRTREFVLN